MCLDLVDLTHGEADVDQYPITWFDALRAHERDAHVTPDAGDIHLGDRICIVHNVDNLTWNTETHTDLLHRDGIYPSYPFCSRAAATAN